MIMRQPENGFFKTELYYTQSYVFRTRRFPRVFGNLQELSARFITQRCVSWKFSIFCHHGLYRLFWSFVGRVRSYFDVIACVVIVGYLGRLHKSITCILYRCRYNKRVYTGSLVYLAYVVGHFVPATASRRMTDARSQPPPAQSTVRHRSHE